MTKIAYIFPGQGSQMVGMGLDLLDNPMAKEKFDIAEKILGWSILEVCQQEEKLAQTLYTQPCLYSIESILVDLLAQNGQNVNLVAGHSLGEYVALYSARVFDFESGLKLVKKRGELMNAAEGGKMVALMKFNREELEIEVTKNPDVVIANDNSDGQVVISGKPSAVDDLLTKIDVKKVVELKVSGAFHSPLMKDAAEDFAQTLHTINFKDATIPVLSNVDPNPSQNASELKERLLKQMTGGVRWREIMSVLSLEKVTLAIEVGPGKVLTGLMKRSCPEIQLKNISNLEDFS